MTQELGALYIAVYLISCIVVVTYTKLRDNIRIAILYFMSYAAVFFEIMSGSVGMLLLVLSAFIVTECRTQDVKKRTLFTKITYRLYDFAFMMLFQYHLFWILLSFVLLRSADEQITVFGFLTVEECMSAVTFTTGTCLSFFQPFRIRPVSELYQVFEEYPIRNFDYDDAMQKRFDLLCAFEDKTYFQRNNSYSSLSVEYFGCFLKRLCSKPAKRLRTPHSVHHQADNEAPVSASQRQKVSRLYIRGYSTPEMQLIRTIGIERGYNSHKIQRKIYELLYSKLFYSSLKACYQYNTHSDLDHYRHYLLYVYFQTVLTKINGQLCSPLSSVFHDAEDIANWSMEGLYIACLGLSFRPVCDHTLMVFRGIVDDFNLDVDRIKLLNARFPEPFPPEPS